MDYEVVGKPILIALPDAFKLRMGTEATVTAPNSRSLPRFALSGNSRRRKPQSTNGKPRDTLIKFLSVIRSEAELPFRQFCAVEGP